MTIKELAKAVIEGNIKSVEVYEDYFQSWGEDKRSSFLAELTAVMVGELAANTRWEEFTYDRCRHCIDYLKKKWNEENIPTQQDAHTDEKDSQAEKPLPDNNPTQYSEELVKLFHGHTELIDELIGQSDLFIAERIKELSNMKGKDGKALIENPRNNLKSCFAKALKDNNLIRKSINLFRKDL